MLKINLSNGEEAGDENTQNNQTLHSESPPREQMTSPPHKKKTFIFHPLSLVILLILAIIVIAYFQREKIRGILKQKTKSVQAVPTPPKPKLELPSEPKAPLDPVYFTLSQVNQIIPPRVWVTLLVLNYDFSFDVEGISFSYPAIDSLIFSLEKYGKKSVKKHLPKKVKCAETVYHFSLSVKDDSLTVSDVLDIIPQDELIAIADTMKSKSKEFGVNFIRYPVKGKKYRESDLPFEIEATYEGLIKVMPLICFEHKNVRIHKMVIKPSSHDKGFNRVRASFALGMISLL